MKTRIISGFFLSLFTLFCLTYSPNTYYILIGLVIFGLTKEITHITQKKGSFLVNMIFLGFVFGLSIIEPSYFTSFIVSTCLISIPLCLLIYEFSTKKLIDTPLFTYFRPSVFFAPLLPYYLIIKTTPQGYVFLLLSILIISTCDTFAYFVGKYIGKTPLSSLSPKKTIEGSIGGLVFSCFFAFLVSYLMNINSFPILFLSLFVGLLSQLGDLHESLFKRVYGIKDSSQLIPGHGGIYDRTDSYLFTIPFVYWIIQLL